MRVCFVSFEYPPDILGGAGTYGDALVKGLRRVGVEVYVITRGGNHSFDENVFRVPTSDSVYWRRLFFIKSAESLLDLLNKKLKFDLVHFNEPHIILGKPRLQSVFTFHSVQANEIMTRLNRLDFSKRVVDIRDLVVKNTIGSICDIASAQRADRIISPSIHLAKLIRSFCLVSDDKISVIPNGLDLETFDSIHSNCTGDLLAKYGLEANNYILYMGRLIPLKGPQYLIEAFGEIRKTNQQLKLAIAGTGDYENHLKSLASQIGGIVFTGQISSLEVKKVLYENSLMVSVPSLYDAFPMVLLEAMACGKPVIGSKVGDIPHMIKHGETGFLTKPGFPSDIEKFTRILYDDANLRVNMGRNGRMLVERHFNVDRMARDTLRVYNSLD